MTEDYPAQIAVELLQDMREKPCRLCQLVRCKIFLFNMCEKNALKLDIMGYLLDKS
jgi:hypothetical protein